MFASFRSFAGHAFGATAAFTGGTVAIALAAFVTASPAEAQVVRHGTVVAGPRGVHASRTVHTPYGTARRSVTVVDRGRPGWWHGHPHFVGYVGPRPGHYYAPGYGYYAVPRGYARSIWVVGGTLPPVMRSYVVVSPAIYGLAPAPAGYGWYYAGTNIVLAALATGVIVQSVAGGW